MLRPLCIKDSCQLNSCEATVLCATCTTPSHSFYLCADCHATHRDNKLYADHRIYYLCKDHPSSTGLDTYCKTCEVVICAVCLLNNHTGCEVAELGSYAEHCRRMLRENSTHLETLVAPELEKVDFGAMREKVEDACKQKISKCTEIIEHVETIKQQVNVVYTALKETLEGKQRELNEYSNDQKAKKLALDEGNELLIRDDYHVVQNAKQVFQNQAHACERNVDKPLINAGMFSRDVQINCDVKDITLTVTEPAMKQDVATISVRQESIISRVTDVTALPSGRLVVCDVGTRRLICVDDRGIVSWSYMPENASETVHRAQYIPEADKLVLVIYRQKVLSFSARVIFMSLAGRPIGQFGRQVKYPSDVTAGAGVIYVCCGEDDRVHVFDISGQELRRFGVGGEFTHMTYLPGSDTLVLGSWHLHRLQTYSGGGERRWAYGWKGSGPGQVNAPHGMCAAPDGVSLLLADLENQRVQLISPQGTYVKNAVAKAQHPSALCYDIEGRLCIADYSGLIRKCVVKC